MKFIISNKPVKNNPPKQTKIGYAGRIMEAIVETAISDKLFLILVAILGSSVAILGILGK